MYRQLHFFFKLKNLNKNILRSFLNNKIFMVFVNLKKNLNINIYSNCLNFLNKNHIYGNLNYE